MVSTLRHTVLRNWRRTIEQRKCVTYQNKMNYRYAQHTKFRVTPWLKKFNTSKINVDVNRIILLIGKLLQK